MKLIICIVQDQDAGALIDDLTEKEFRVTKLSSTGGFLKSGNTTLLIGTDEEELPSAINIIEEKDVYKRQLLHYQWRYLVH